MARSYSDRQTREDAEERGETTQINALSRLVKQAYTQGHWGPAQHANTTFSGEEKWAPGLLSLWPAASQHSRVQTVLFAELSGIPLCP